MKEAAELAHSRFHTRV